MKAKKKTPGSRKARGKEAPYWAEKIGSWTVQDLESYVEMKIIYALDRYRREERRRESTARLLNMGRIGNALTLGAIATGYLGHKDAGGPPIIGGPR